MRLVDHRPVIVVVHVGPFDDIKLLAERVDWLMHTVFPEMLFPCRTMVFYGNVAPLREYFGNQLYLFDGNHSNNNWESLYEKLLNGSLNKCVIASQAYLGKMTAKEFDFGFMLTLHEDLRMTLNYGREDRPWERLILRALFKICRGNVLFGHWGVCFDMPTSTSDYELTDLFYRPHGPYLTGPDYIRLYGGDTALIDSFACVLGSFFPHPHRAWSIHNQSLPNDILHMLLLKGQSLRNPQAVNAEADLFFASDYVTVSHHKWQRFHSLQRVLVVNYINLRTTWDSSTRAELQQDVLDIYILAVVISLLNIVVSFLLMLVKMWGSFADTEQSKSLFEWILHIFFTGPLTLLVLFIADSILFESPRPKGPRKDHLSRLTDFGNFAANMSQLSLPFLVAWHFLDYSDSQNVLFDFCLPIFIVDFVCYALITRLQRQFAPLQASFYNAVIPSAICLYLYMPQTWEEFPRIPFLAQIFVDVLWKGHLFDYTEYAIGRLASVPGPEKRNCIADQKWLRASGHYWGRCFQSSVYVGLGISICWFVVRMFSLIWRIIEYFLVPLSVIVVLLSAYACLWYIYYVKVQKNGRRVD